MRRFIAEEKAKAAALHRRWDQPTSVQAADAIAPSISEMQELVEEYAYACGARGFTDVDLNKWFNSTTSAYRSRRAELVKLGRIRDSGLRNRLATGRYAIVWMHVKPEQEGER